MLDVGLPRLRMSRSFLQDIFRTVSLFSRGSVAGNHRQHFFDPAGSNTIAIPDRIEKNTRSEARKANFQQFRGKRSCERARYFFNGLQILLQENWPEVYDLIQFIVLSLIHI